LDDVILGRMIKEAGMFYIEELKRARGKICQKKNVKISI